MLRLPRGFAEVGSMTGCGDSSGSMQQLQGQKSRILVWLDWTGLNWTGLNRTGPDYTAMKWAGREWTALDRKTHRLFLLGRHQVAARRAPHFVQHLRPLHRRPRADLDVLPPLCTHESHICGSHCSSHPSRQHCQHPCQDADDLAGVTQEPSWQSHLVCSHAMCLLCYAQVTGAQLPPALCFFPLFQGTRPRALSEIFLRRATSASGSPCARSRSSMGSLGCSAGYSNTFNLASATFEAGRASPKTLPVAARRWLASTAAHKLARRRDHADDVWAVQSVKCI